MTYQAWYIATARDLRRHDGADENGNVVARVSSPRPAQKRWR